MIDVFVVLTVVRSPIERRILEGAGPEKQGRQTNAPACLESLVRKEPVISQRDAQAGRDEEKEKETYVEPVQSIGVDKPRRSDDRSEKSRNQEKAGSPVNAVQGKIRDHENERIANELLGCENTPHTLIMNAWGMKKQSIRRLSIWE